MGGNFDLGCFWVTPENVVSGMGDTHKECVAFGVWFELGLAFTRWTCPCLAAKRPEVGEVLHKTSGFGHWQDSGVIAVGNCIVQPKCMTESARPELHGHVGTGKDGLHCICNQAVSLLGWSILAG